MDWLRTTICEVSNDPPGYLNCNNTATLPPRSVPVTVSIQLDDFPEEISWSIQDAVDGTVFAEVPFGVYTDAGSRVGETVFLPAGSSVVFKIEDSFGDGLCCNTPGNYLVSLGSRPYGDVLVSGGGDFHGTIFHDFNVPTDYKETNTEDDTPPIGEGKIPLTIVLQLDESPREIGWKVERLGIEVETVIHIPAGVYKIPGATIVRTVILEKNELYYFYVYDVTSNGIDGGMVQLFLGTAETEDESKIIFESDGAFKGGVDYSFLATEDPLPTEAPLGDSNAYLTLQIYFDLFPGEIGVQLRASYAETAIARQSTQENTVIFFRPPRYYSNYVNERVTERIPIPMPRAGTSREFILIVTDSFSDGLCCNSNRTNQTGYTLYNGDPIAGDVLVDSRFIGVAREVSIFTVENDGVDGSENNNGQTSTGPEIDLIEIKVSITLDNFPDETGFYIEDDSGFKIADFPAGTYKDLGQLVEEVFTVPAGLYTFTITDAYGDGINRDDSYYRIDFVESGVDRRPVLAGNGIFVSQKSHVFALEGKSANYPMTIKFTTDEKPEEFGFVVKRLDILDADALVSSVPQGTYTEKGASITETIMVTERALYRIFLEDAGKDGIGGQIEIIMGSDNFNGKSLTIDGVDLSADHIKIYAGQPPATRPSGISMDLRITFDDFPQEVEWILVGGVDLFGSRTSPSGKHEVIAYGPMEPYGEALARKENVETIILPDHKGEKIFSLIVTDSAGDGGA